MQEQGGVGCRTIRDKDETHNKGWLQSMVTESMVMESMVTESNETPRVEAIGSIRRFRSRAVASGVRQKLFFFTSSFSKHRARGVSESYIDGIPRSLFHALYSTLFIPRSLFHALYSTLFILNYWC
jgi:hypothetical protein